MQIPISCRAGSRALACLAILCAITSSASSAVESRSAAKTAPCPGDDTGLRLPPGFCATVFADDLGHARHLVVAPNGVVYVNTWSSVYYGNTPVHRGGFLVALKDTAGSGKAVMNERFGETVESGGRGGTGIGIYKGSLYAEINDRIVRYSLPAGGIAPETAPDVIVSGLPLGGDHPMHPFIIDANGDLFVDVASATNSCQLKNRTLHSPGAKPCTELETRGGIWRYDAKKTNQTFSSADRFATGIRNGEGFAIDSSGRLFVTQHGRDQLRTNWPEFYQPEQEATLPAEELMELKQGGDYGWPECYYDSFVNKLVLAPEYGGDGKSVGLCANKVGPTAAYPAHWAPNAAAYYDKTEFPAHYRNGIFIAFHGSWNRAPYPQGGYNVVFQPMSGERPAGNCEVFADGFAGQVKSPAGAAYRPSGLAVGPDGALYVSDDSHGRIYRIVYQGGAQFDTAKVVPCPSGASPAGEIVEASAKPPEGTNPDAGKAAGSVLPKGVTRQTVALGDRIYHGQVGGASCTGCHGENGQGTPLGPAFSGKGWLWSDGSLAGLKKTITEGVAKPKHFRGVMPPMGGADLTADQVSALAAYIWSISHGGASK